MPKKRTSKKKTKQPKQQREKTALRPARKKGKKKTATAKKKSVAKQKTPLALVAAAVDDPLGACFFTDQFGQNICQELTKSQCAGITGSRFRAGGRCQ